MEFKPKDWLRTINGFFAELDRPQPLHGLEIVIFGQLRDDFFREKEALIGSWVLYEDGTLRRGEYDGEVKPAALIISHQLDEAELINLTYSINTKRVFPSHFNGVKIQFDKHKDRLKAMEGVPYLVGRRDDYLTERQIRAMEFDATSLTF